MKKRNKIKLILLQYRDNKKVRQEEIQSFLKFCDIASNQIKVLNTFDTPNFKSNAFKGYDGVLIGGASETSVFSEDLCIKCGKELIVRAIEDKIPTFASCFGFQLAISAFNGEIITQEIGFEMGSVLISLEEKAKDDPLVYDLPDPFYGISVHKQKAIKAPKNFISLAKTDQCLHIIKSVGSPFWGFQFHPEVDANTLKQRLTLYKRSYTKNDEELRAVLSNIHDTFYANDLCKKFIDRILLT